MPAARTSTTTWPGPGTGGSRSSTTTLSRLPSSLHTTTFTTADCRTHPRRGRRRAMLWPMPRSATRHVVVLAPMPLEMDAIVRAFGLNATQDDADAPWTGRGGEV